MLTSIKEVIIRIIKRLLSKVDTQEASSPPVNDKKTTKELVRLYKEWSVGNQ